MYLVITKTTEDSLIKNLMTVVIHHTVKFHVLIIPTKDIIIFKEVVEDVIIKEEVTMEVLHHLVMDIIKEVIRAVVVL